jgi:hypothetical protein
MSKINDMVGKTFGKLYVIRRAVKEDGRKDFKLEVLCSCACGAPDKFIRAGNILRGLTKACGCLPRGAKKSAARRAVSSYLVDGADELP